LVVNLMADSLVELIVAEEAVRKELKKRLN
jgi:hypothetical protein